jgi:hypothetical protein
MTDSIFFGLKRKSWGLSLERGHVFLQSSLVFLFLSNAQAGPRDYLFRDERVCDLDNVFCFRGTLSYEANPRLIHLRARIQVAPGPGMLRIRLAGANQLGHRHFAPLEIRVRGRYSEIINHKMIPDHPDVQAWEVERVDFIAHESL